MSYKIAIDMCCFDRKHKGGKDEVAYNLLRGFEKIGVSEQVVCFCYKKLVPIIKAANHDVKICVVPRIRTIKRLESFHAWIRSYYEDWWAHKNGIKLIVIPNKQTANRKYRMKTLMIPHDIEVFENGILPGVYYSKLNHKRRKRQTIRDFRNRDYIIAISDFDKGEMVRFLPWASDKITRIYDPIRFSTNEKEFEEKKYITVLNIQHKHKNIITVVKAFKEIMNQTDLNLILVGKSGEGVKETKQFVSDNKMDNRVIFTGFVSDEELGDIIGRTRIYINASHFEGFGMAAIEMMGREVPAIVADNTAQREVTMGLCRYYSPADDSHALAETIMDELKHPGTKMELQDISQNVRDKYDYRRIATEYWKFFNRCIEG